MQDTENQLKKIIYDSPQYYIALQILSIENTLDTLNTEK